VSLAVSAASTLTGMPGDTQREERLREYAWEAVIDGGGGGEGWVVVQYCEGAHDRGFLCKIFLFTKPSRLDACTVATALHIISLKLHIYI
jgi:hypothetical protein